MLTMLTSARDASYWLTSILPLSSHLGMPQSKKMFVDLSSCPNEIIFSDYVDSHSAALQLRSHSYGYAPCSTPCIAIIHLARNIRFHLHNYLYQLFALIGWWEIHGFPVFGDCAPGYLNALFSQNGCNLIIAKGFSGTLFGDQLSNMSTNCR